MSVKIGREKEFVIRLFEDDMMFYDREANLDRQTIERYLRILAEFDKMQKELESFYEPLPPESDEI